MSLAAYERLRAQLELYGLLDEAEADVAAGCAREGIDTSSTESI